MVKPLRWTFVLIGIFIAIYAAAAVLMGWAISQRPPGWYQGIAVASLFMVIAIVFVVVAVIGLLYTIVVACREPAENRRDADATAGAVAILAAASVVAVLLIVYPAGVGFSYFVADWFR